MDGHDDTKQYIASAHGQAGPVKITTYNYEWDVHAKVMAAAGQVPGWEYNQDPNAGNMLGVSTIQGELVVLQIKTLLLTMKPPYSQPRGTLSLPDFVLMGVLSGTLLQTGVRYSSALSYIHANGVSKRPNLHILLSTTVTRLILDDSETPRVTGVEFAAGPTSECLIPCAGNNGLTGNHVLQRRSTSQL